MKITLNNREEVLEKDNMSVSEFLIARKYSYKMRIVKINGALVPKESYGITYIREGDNVQMLYLMSGG